MTLINYNFMVLFIACITTTKISYKINIIYKIDHFQIVLDVNCGLGILSLMAAHAGAHHVYAIESSSLAELARQVIIDNGLAERITVIHGAIQDIELSATHVDVILSDWMG